MTDVRAVDLFEIVKAAVEDLDRTADPGRVIEAATPLFDDGGPLDSLALVRLVADLEMRVEDSTGAAIVLADEKAMSRGNPYRTVGTLVDLIRERLAEANV